MCCAYIGFLNQRQPALDKDNEKLLILFGKSDLIKGEPLHTWLWEPELGFDLGWILNSW